MDYGKKLVDIGLFDKLRLAQIEGIISRLDDGVHGEAILLLQELLQYTYQQELTIADLLTENS